MKAKGRRDGGGVEAEGAPRPIVSCEGEAGGRCSRAMADTRPEEGEEAIRRFR